MGDVKEGEGGSDTWVSRRWCDQLSLVLGTEHLSMLLGRRWTLDTWEECTSLWLVNLIVYSVLIGHWYSFSLFWLVNFTWFLKSCHQTPWHSHWLDTNSWLQQWGCQCQRRTAPPPATLTSHPDCLCPRARRTSTVSSQTGAHPWMSGTRCPGSSPSHGHCCCW